MCADRSKGYWRVDLVEQQKRWIKSDKRINEEDVTMRGDDESGEVVGYWGMCWGGVDRVDGRHN